MTKPLTIELIHSRCEEVGDCWIWTGALTGPGYPSMTYGGKRGMNLRREVLRIEGRPSPAGHRVINTCLNPKCLNPAHLKSLTPAQFNAWLGRRGRLSTPAVRAARTRSARELRAKLTIELVMAVEDEFGIEISDDEAEACRTVQDCVDLVASKLGMVAAGASEGGEAA